MEPETLDIEWSQRLSRIGGVMLKTILILFLLIAIYFVLLPIVVWSFTRMGVLKMGGDYPFLDVLAMPIEWLAEKWPGYGNLLDGLSELILP